MKKALVFLIGLSLFLVLGCSRGIVVVKTQPAVERERAVVGEKPAVNIPASENHLRQAKKFLADGKYKQAQMHCEKAIEFNHSNWEAHYCLGKIMQKRKAYAPAIEILGIGLRYSPENNAIRSEIHLAIGISWENLGQFDNARREYGLAVALNPSNQPAIEGRNRIKMDKIIKDWGKKKNTRHDG